MFCVRCVTCNKIIGNKWLPFLDLLKKGYKAENAYIQLDITRECCKRHFTSHKDLHEILV